MRLSPPFLSGPRLALAAPSGRPPAYRLAGGDAAAGPMFFALEVELYRPPATAPATSPGRLARPRLALAQLPSPAEAHEVLRASDLGYRSPATGADPTVRVFPPVLETAFELDRSLRLPPAEAGAAVGWGTARLSNADRRLDRFASHNGDARGFRLLAGRKRLDAARGGYMVDPPLAELVEAGSGVAAGLELGDGALEVALRDASYWLERPLQPAAYSGAGGLNGGADLAGRPLPRCRGGTGAAPVRSVAPVLVDAAKRIYQYSDGPGSVVALYEGGVSGGGGIANAGDVADLYSGSVAGGFYRTNNARGLLQLGANPVRPIVLDVVGRFPSGAAPATAGAIALQMLREDLGVPADMLDADSFLGLDAAFPWTAGRAWDGTQPVDGAAAVGEFLGSLGARLVPTRRRRLRALPLRAPAAGERPAASYGPEAILSLKPRRLPAGLSPPAFRARVAHSRIHSPQTELAPAVGAAERARLGAPWQYAAAAGAAGTLAAYRRLSDPAPVESALLVAAHASALAAAMAALWGDRRRLFDVELPLELALRHDLGELLVVSYPAAGLDAGAVGRIVGEQLRSRDGSATFSVLV